MTSGARDSVLWSLTSLVTVGTVAGMTEAQLLERFLARRDEGAEAAYAALVALHGPMVWGVCRGVLADRHAAEDAFQATFLVLARKAASIRRRDTVGPWLHGVARRIAIRARDQAARRVAREGRAMQTESGPDPSRREQIEALHEEIGRLPERYRSPVVLCHLEGRTLAEAARLLGCPVATVGVRLARARGRLRARLTRRGLALPATLAGPVLGPPSAEAAVPAGLAEAATRAAMSVAAGEAVAAGAVPAAVAQLASGEMRSMLVSKLTATVMGLAAAGTVTLSVGMLTAGGRPTQAVSDPARAPVAPADGGGEDRVDGTRSLNNLRLLARAMEEYVVKNGGRLPPAAIRGGDRPLLSWRVALLPYLGHRALYEKFRLDEPWDSPHHRPLLEEMPGDYAPAAREGRSVGSTPYQVFVGPGTPFEGAEGLHQSGIVDGTSNTLLIVEAARPVPWTKPEDLVLGPESPLAKLRGPYDGGYPVAMADGTAWYLRGTIDAGALRRLISPRGGEAYNPDDFAAR